MENTSIDIPLMILTMFSLPVFANIGIAMMRDHACGFDIKRKELNSLVASIV